jgi:hypothetical protein
MMGRLSDRPMIRAASIPHLGQTTPTAAFGLRAIRSLLTRLDAVGPLTVLVTTLLSVQPGIWPRVSVFTSLFRPKTPIFPTDAQSMQDFARPPHPSDRTHPTFVDTTPGAPTFPYPSLRAESAGNDGFSTYLLPALWLSTELSETPLRPLNRRAREYSKTGRKTQHF